MKRKKQTSGNKILLVIVLINLLITDFIIWLWFQYSLANEWLFNDLNRILIELLKPFADAH